MKFLANNVIASMLRGAVLQKKCLSMVIEVAHAYSSSALSLK
jgi:hypothetical protein